MKRIWIQRIGAAVLCAVLLAGCMPGGPAADSTASADPLTGQEQQYPGQRPAAVVIDNAPGSTTQWGIGSASVVLEAAAVRTPPPALCLVYPSVSAMPTVGPVTLGQDLFWRLLSGQQVLPIQRGCDLYTRNFLDYWNLRAVDALETGRNAFTTGNTDWASPLWCTNGQSVAKVLGSLSLSVRAVRGPCGIRRQHAGRGHPRRTHCPGPAASADRRPPAGCGCRRRSSGGSTVPVRQHHPLCLRYRHRHLRDAAQ